MGVAVFDAPSFGAFASVAQMQQEQMRAAQNYYSADAYAADRAPPAYDGDTIDGECAEIPVPPLLADQSASDPAPVTRANV